jgi:DNA-directed RNA polymerase specialized sigma24 family protein
MPDRDDDDEPLAHPHHDGVLAVIRAVLLDNRWPKHEIDDGIGKVVLRAWASKKPHPTTVGAWKALCRKIAKNMAIDRIRSEKVGGKEATEATDRLDESEASNGPDTMDDAIDRQRALREMRALVPAKQLPVFDRWALGFSQEEIAEELSAHPREVSRTVSSLRGRFAKRYAAAAVAALLAVVAAYFIFRDKIVDDEAHDQPPPPSSAPTVAPSGPSPGKLAQRAKVEELRKLASADCAARKWGDCNKDLDQASGLDPSGEQTRAVQRLRSKVERGLAQQEIESKEAPGARSLKPERAAKLVEAIAGSRGQALRLVCARGAEPGLCDQLAAAITSAGWNVTRDTLGSDAGVGHGMLVEVATDAGDATQAAADALAGGLEKGRLFARGPDDMAPGGDVRLRLTVFAP